MRELSNTECLMTNGGVQIELGTLVSDCVVALGMFGGAAGGATLGTMAAMSSRAVPALVIGTGLVGGMAGMVAGGYLFLGIYSIFAGVHGIINPHD